MFLPATICAKMPVSVYQTHYNRYCANRFHSVINLSLLLSLKVYFFFVTVLRLYFCFHFDSLYFNFFYVPFVCVCGGFVSHVYFVLAL